MRVTVDATALVGRPTGVGVMTRELLRGLGGREDVDVSAFALTWRGRGGLAEVLPAGVRATTRPMAARPLRQAWSRADVPKIELWTGPIDVVHGPNFVVPPARKAAEVMTVHDLTFIHHPELCTTDTLGYPPLIKRAISRGAWVHAVSAFVADEVVEVFAVDRDRVVVVHNGAPDPNTQADGERGSRLAGAERYIVAVGTVEPRKDLPSLVAAFAALHEEDLALVIAGQDGWGADALTNAIDSCPPDVRSRIRRMGWIDDTDRGDLMAGAAVVAYPSLYEGFGLIPLEAMAAGTPVVSTTVGAIEETVGDAALLVPPSDSDALAGALEKVLADDALAAELVARGTRRLAAFSWGDTVDGIVGMYRRSADDVA